MRLPTPLLRKNPKAYKNTFGHLLILAGSPRMLGAAALCGLSAMRSGAGLVTIGIPKSLNLTLQKKISPVIMTWPLPETKDQTLSPLAWPLIKKNLKKYTAIAIGPGLGQNPSTQHLIQRIIAESPLPLVIDADALNALAGHLEILNKTNTPKILTPHPGEFRRLTNDRRPKTDDDRPMTTDKERKEAAKKFAKAYYCILVLKGRRTLVADPGGKIYLNTTGNVGMASAGTGDVLTGMIAALLAQGIPAFDAAKFGVYLHGKAGDLAAKKFGKASLIASDLIDAIPLAIMKK